MIASELILSREDAINLKLTDAYSVHRIVYDLFEDIRSDAEKKSSVPSGILFVDKGIKSDKRIILILSNRHPKKPSRGTLNTQSVSDAFLAYGRYRFQVVLNPTKREKSSGKTVAIIGREAIRDWFIANASEKWGFQVRPETFIVETCQSQRFKKANHQVTQSTATFTGELYVTNRELFIDSFRRGVGRGRAFGFGLLQIVPMASQQLHSEGNQS